MSTGAINGAAGFGGSNPLQTNQFGELSSEDFIKILITELTTQDPFEPNDSAQILEQLSSLRNIESQTALQDQLGNLVYQNQLAQAGGMIGKTVQGLSMQNDTITGEVTAVHVVGGQAVLELDTGKTLPLVRVQMISDSGVPTETE